jgi:hypothetical protein
VDFSVSAGDRTSVGELLLFLNVKLFFVAFDADAGISAG